MTTRARLLLAWLLLPAATHGLHAAEEPVGRRPYEMEKI